MIATIAKKGIRLAGNAAWGPLVGLAALTLAAFPSPAQAGTCTKADLRWA